MQQAACANNFSRLVGQIDIEIGKPGTSSDDKAQLYCNRGLCHQRVNLNRKALKDYDEALRIKPEHILAILQRGIVLQVLKRPEEARRCWKKAEELFQPQHDLTLLLEAQALLSGVLPPPLGAAGVSLAASASPTETPAAANPEPSTATVQAASRPQAKAQQALANGNASSSTPCKAKSGKAAAKEPSALVRAACLDHSVGVGIAVSHINEGKLDQAIEILDYIISNTTGPQNSGAHIARGTARAMLRDLEGAVEDFSLTIKAMPGYGDAWMRRGQARTALGEDEDALQDFDRCLKLTTDPARQAEACTEIGKLLHKKRDYRRAAKQLQKAVDLMPNSLQAQTFLGLCHVSMGDIQQGASHYEQVLRLDPDNLEACVYLAQACKEEASVKAAERAFSRAREVDKGRQRLSQLARMHAHMCQGLGQHRRAIGILTEALGTDLSPDARVECLHLRGACHHALGNTLEAVQDYESTFSINSSELGEDAKSRQFLTFYQREMALYMRSNIDRRVDEYCLDHDLPPEFKELWCKKMPPSAKLFKVWKPLQKAALDQASDSPGKLEPDRLRTLIRTADDIGKLLQYRQQGFLPNIRQQRMAGLAVIELAQAVQELMRHRRSGASPLLASKGSSANIGSHPFDWRDAMDIIVKWRQLSEPNDQVIWVDLLTEEEFNAGFGSHTPMFTGQTKCVRYYMNFERALGLHKKILAEEGKAFDGNNKPIPLAGEHKQAELQDAKTAEEMWKAVGQDSWVVVPVESITRPGHIVEGTRLQLVKLRDQPDGYEFSIKTPVTPARWKAYDQELHVLWEQTLSCLEKADGPTIAKSILHFAYFWYNFMPLARGTAAAGYIFILSMFLAAGMPVTGSIPKGYQVDWEAILSRSSEPFITSVSAWLYPPAARGEETPAALEKGIAPDLKQLSSVKNFLATARSRLNALNAPSSSS